METGNGPAAAAALSICESLLLCLGDKSIISEADILGLLRDAAQSHTDAAKGSKTPDHHREVADLIEGIIAGGNSVRRRH